MKKYESIIIVNPNTIDEEIKELIEYIKKIITDNNGKIIKVEDLGNKKLAYEIKKNKEGYYIRFEFEVNPVIISELERIYRIKDEIMKFITIKTDY